MSKVVKVKRINKKTIYAIKVTKRMIAGLDPVPKIFRDACIRMWYNGEYQTIIVGKMPNGKTLFAVEGDYLVLDGVLNNIDAKTFKKLYEEKL